MTPAAVGTFLAGGGPAGDRDHDRLVQALNERFMDQGGDHPLAYADELPGLEGILHRHATMRVLAGRGWVAEGVWRLFRLCRPMSLRYRFRILSRYLRFRDQSRDLQSLNRCNGQFRPAGRGGQGQLVVDRQASRRTRPLS
jgi:hypothetical protein